MADRTNTLDDLFGGVETIIQFKCKIKPGATCFWETIAVPDGHKTIQGYDSTISDYRTAGFFGAYRYDEASGGWVAK